MAVEGAEGSLSEEKSYSVHDDAQTEHPQYHEDRDSREGDVSIREEQSGSRGSSGQQDEATSPSEPPLGSIAQSSVQEVSTAVRGGTVGGINSGPSGANISGGGAGGSSTEEKSYSARTDAHTAHPQYHDDHDAGEGDFSMREERTGSHSSSGQRPQAISPNGSTSSNGANPQNLPAANDISWDGPGSGNSANGRIVAISYSPASSPPSHPSNLYQPVTNKAMGSGLEDISEELDPNEALAAEEAAISAELDRIQQERLAAGAAAAPSEAARDEQEGPASEGVAEQASLEYGQAAAVREATLEVAEAGPARQAEPNGLEREQTGRGPTSAEQAEAEEEILPQQTPSSSQALTSFNRDQPVMNQGTNEDVKSVYDNSYYGWNHVLRNDRMDVPVFWRIPRSASATVEAIMSLCYRIVLANAGHDKEEEVLGVITAGTGADYVNVDMSRPAGIERARAMGLGALPATFVVSTPFLFDAAAVFRDAPARGRCFTLLRHPVARAVSLYHHYQTDESGNPATARYRGLSIDAFAEELAENNWMVRFLANKRAGALRWHDLELAKDIFGRTCLVGLVDKAEESLRRYEQLFRWEDKVSNSEDKDRCVERALANGNKQKEHPTYEGTAAWEALRKKNEYDCLLYEFAENLYTQQSMLFGKDD